MNNTNTPKQGGQQQQGGKWTGPRRQPYNAAARPAVARSAEHSGGGTGGGLEGHIIDCGQPKHADTYNTTMEEIVNHVRIEFKDGELVA